MKIPTFKDIPIHNHKSLQDAPKGMMPYYQVYVCPNPKDKVVRLALRCGAAFEDKNRYEKAIKAFRKHLRTLDFPTLAKWTSVLTILPLEKVNHATGEGSYIHIANRIVREESLDAWIEKWKAKNGDKPVFVVMPKKESIQGE